MAKKTVTKKTESDATEGVVEMRTPASAFGEWFDRWPEMFAQRWPESLRGVPFMEEGFRIEQMIDDDGALVVRAELPGLDPAKDVSITIDQDRLTISGSREERSEKREKGSYRSEFRYGSFERSVRLPAGAHGDDAEANYHDGILEIRVPVDEDQAGVTTVPITHRE